MYVSRASILPIRAETAVFRNASDGLMMSDLRLSEWRTMLRRILMASFRDTADTQRDDDDSSMISALIALRIDGIKVIISVLPAEATKPLRNDRRPSSKWMSAPEDGLSFVHGIPSADQRNGGALENRMEEVQTVDE